MRIEGVSGPAFNLSSLKNGAKDYDDQAVKDVQEGKKQDVAVSVNISMLKKAQEMGQNVVDKLLK